MGRKRLRTFVDANVGKKSARLRVKSYETMSNLLHKKKKNGINIPNNNNFVEKKKN